MPPLSHIRRDLDFLLHDWLGTAGEGAQVDRETIDALLDLSEQFASEGFLSHHKAADIEEPRLEEDGVHVHPAIGPALRQYADLGLFSAGFAPDLGGLGLPYSACSASFALFAAANVATAAYPMLTVANARLIATFGSRAQIDTFARPQIDGRWFGTMCLSEPQAGSSLADVRTRAVAEGSDSLGERYRLVGNKMWISGGDQDVSENIVHLVLAKIPDLEGALPPGSKSISLFIVPKILPDGSRNDVAVAGLNHKMGYRGTANCLLNLGEKAGATGWLVGEPGDGLRQMFQMMNEARIGVGIGAAALAMRGYGLSLDYARERLQGRPPGATGGGPVRIIDHADVRHMLLQQKCYAEGALALCLYCAKLVDAHEDEDAAELLGLLTPIAKSWPSEFGLAANDLAIQVHGGYGYTRDFDVEQLYRDNRLNPIHEGTTGIQAIDLVGRKLLRGNGAGYAVLRQRVAAACARGAGSDLEDAAAAVEEGWHRIDAAVDQLRTIGTPNALENATSFLRAFGHATLAWLWLDMALAAGSSSAVGAGKSYACRYFAATELPKIEAWLAPVGSAFELASGMPEEAF